MLEISAHEGASQAELAERLAVKPPSVAKVRGLERDSHVQRLAEPADGRAQLVHLTASGRRVRRELDTAWRAAERGTLAAPRRASGAVPRDLVARAVGWP